MAQEKLNVTPGEKAVLALALEAYAAQIKDTPAHWTEDTKRAAWAHVRSLAKKLGVDSLRDDILTAGVRNEDDFWAGKKVL